MFWKAADHGGVCFLGIRSMASSFVGTVVAPNGSLRLALYQ